jgi:prenyltransferase beta subunit
LKHKNIIFGVIFVLTLLLFIPITNSEDTTKGDLLSGFITSSNKSEGGFSDNPDETMSNIRSTYQAIKTLSNLGKLNLIDKNAVAIWINESQNSDGGFPNYVNGTSDMISTLYAVESLKILGYIPKNNISEWINQCYNADLGFSITPNSSSSILGTYSALKALDLLNVSIDLYNSSDWIVTLQNNESLENYGAFSSDGSSYQLISTLYALETLNLTNDINRINKTAVISWIISCQNMNKNDPKNYGSYKSNSLSSDFSVINCYSAINSLRILNVSQINLTSYTNDWILACQNLNTGGFSTSKDGKSSSIASSYYAVSALKFIDGLSFVNSIVAGIPFNFSILWILLIILGVAVIAYIYIKKKYY